MRRLLLPLAFVLALAPAATASAATPTEPVDLHGVAAHKRVVDTILRPRGPIARAAAARNERFADAQGRAFTIATDIPDVDLKPFANVLAAVAHGDEITKVRVTAVRMAEIPGVCGSPDAVACYAPDDPQRSFAGQMWFAVDDRDYIHTLVHEYGHHVDNQLLNLAHLGTACSFSNDGSRNWFFERELEDNVLDAGVGCRAGTAWDRLLGEVYAEDFAALNGIVGWTLTSVRSPTGDQTNALAFDMAERFRPTRARWNPRVRAGTTRRQRVKLRSWTFLDTRVTGARGTNVDLYLRRHGKRRNLRRSTTSGRTERIREIAAPGDYDVVVRSRRGTGTARVVIDAL